jgi:hypothetical protein
MICDKNARFSLNKFCVIYDRLLIQFELSCVFYLMYFSESNPFLPFEYDECKYDFAKRKEKPNYIMQSERRKSNKQLYVFRTTMKIVNTYLLKFYSKLITSNKSTSDTYAFPVTLILSYYVTYLFTFL